MVGVDGGLGDVESRVFCEQVLHQFPEDDRELLTRLMNGGKVNDDINGVRRLRRSLYGIPQGVGYYSRWYQLGQAAYAAWKLGFIR